MTPDAFAKDVVKQTLYTSPPRWIWAGTGSYAISWVVCTVLCYHCRAVPGGGLADNPLHSIEGPGTQEYLSE